MDERLSSLRGKHTGEEVFVIGKGPSLRRFQPFDDFRDRVCIGVNNVYRYFPWCSYVTAWHKEFFYEDAEYLARQEDFLVVYSPFHGFPHGVRNGVAVDYLAEFPLAGTPEGTVDCWRENPDRWMYKATYATAVRLAWWLGAARITLVGFDFSLSQGRTADDALLNTPIKLRSYTVEQIFEAQSAAYTNLQTELAREGVSLRRIGVLDEAHRAG